jgi:hypothetical protein
MNELDRVTCYNPYRGKFIHGVITKIDLDGYLISWEKDSSPIVSMTRLYPDGQDPEAAKRRMYECHNKWKQRGRESYD